MNVPKRGDLIFINFNPQAGHEQAGYRPAVILSPYEFNKMTRFAVLCPITSKQKGYPFEVVLPKGLNIHGVILTDQVKSLDWEIRGFKHVDEVPNRIVKECLDKIALILSFNEQ